MSRSVNSSNFVFGLNLAIEDKKSKNTSHLVKVPPDYDYARSTTDNYEWRGAGKAPFVGEYSGLRARMDYGYHRHYTAERQYLHDALIDKTFCTIFKSGGLVCEKLEDNWLVFTAGTMGVGKGYVLEWLNEKDLFPLDSFVAVDPDRLRDDLPETAEYMRRDPLTAGQFTQKEVGYISEVLTLHGLKSGKNVLVDGSLRDEEWYIKYIQNLKTEFPALCVGIIYVTADLLTVMARVQQRAVRTGRAVPPSTIIETFEQVPRSVLHLAQYADVIATFDNGGAVAEPRLISLEYPTSKRNNSKLMSNVEDVNVRNSAYGTGIDATRSEDSNSRGLRPDDMDRSMSIADLQFYEEQHMKERVKERTNEIGIRRSGEYDVSPTRLSQSSSFLPSPLLGKQAVASARLPSTLAITSKDALGSNSPPSHTSSKSQPDKDFDESTEATHFDTAGPPPRPSIVLSGVRPVHAISEGPVSRGLLLRREARDDNLWWRDEFRALWEMRCIVPDYSRSPSRSRNDS